MALVASSLLFSPDLLFWAMMSANAASSWLFFVRGILPVSSLSIGTALLLGVRVPLRSASCSAARRSIDGCVFDVAPVFFCCAVVSRTLSELIATRCFSLRSSVSLMSLRKFSVCASSRAFSRLTSEESCSSSLCRFASSASSPTLRVLAALRSLHRLLMLTSSVIMASFTIPSWREAHMSKSSSMSLLLRSIALNSSSLVKGSINFGAFDRPRGSVASRGSVALCRGRTCALCRPLAPTFDHEWSSLSSSSLS